MENLRFPVQIIEDDRRVPQTWVTLSKVGSLEVPQLKQGAARQFKLDS